MKIANFNAISAYYNGKNTFGGWSNTLDRSGAFPVEKYSVFNSIDDALKYVNGEVIASMGATDGKAYDGQIIAVKDATTGIQKAYIVDSTAVSGLTPVGDTSDILPVLDQLSDAISANIDSIAVNASKITLISNDISAIREATLGNLDALEATLKRDLFIDITENTGTDTGILKTYTLTQGGQELPVKINIPKDFLVKSATVETCKTADDPVVGYKVGDTYIDFILNTKDSDTGSEANEHMYLKVTDLIQMFKGSDGDIITVNVANDGTVTASVKDGSISTVKIADKAITTDKLDDGAVTTIKIADSNVTTAKIADYNVTTAKIADENVTTAKLAPYAVTSDKLSSDAVTTVKIVDKAVTTAKLDDGAVTTDKIADSNVTYSKLATDVTTHFATKAELSAEEQARSTADSALDSRITANTTAIANELTAREAAFNTVDSKAEKNKQDISAEISRAQAAELVLSDAISAEVDRSTKADEKHTSDISALSISLNSSVNEINGRINNISSELTGTYATKDELTNVSDALALSASGLSNRIDGVEESISTLNTEITTFAKLSDVTIADEALNGRIDVVSNSLSDYAKVSSVTAIDTAYKAADEALNGRIDVVSNSLSDYTTIIEVSGISTSLNAEIAKKLDIIEFAELSVKVGLDRASADNKVVTSADLTAAVADLAGAMHFAGVEETLPETIDGYKAGDVIIISGTSKEYVCDGTKWVELGDENIYATDSELTQEREARIAADNYLSGAIDAICANYATKAELTSEANLRITADAELSTAIDNKVLINDVSSSYVNIKKVTQQEYFDVVNSAEGADPNTVYIVNAEGEYNMFNERITNLAAPSVDTDATNKAYVDQAIESATADVVANSISAVALGDTTFTAVNNVVTLDISAIFGGNAND